MKYIILNCPAIYINHNNKYDCDKADYSCQDCTNCVMKRIVEKLKLLQIITFEHGIKGMFNVEAKVELKQISEILDMLEIEECK